MPATVYQQAEYLGLSLIINGKMLTKLRLTITMKVLSCYNSLNKKKIGPILINPRPT